MKHGVSSMTKSCQKIVSEFKEKCIVVRMFGYVLSNIQSNSVITNRLGLAKFVRYNREFVVSKFVNVLNMDFGTKKMGKICLL